MERFERNVTKASTPIGVISFHYGTAAWQVGALGEVKWIVSNSKPLLRRPDDPPWFSKYSATDMDSVEVIIVDGTVGHEVWNNSKAKVIVAVRDPNHWKRQDVAREGVAPMFEDDPP